MTPSILNIQNISPNLTGVIDFGHFSVKITILLMWIPDKIVQTNPPHECFRVAV